MGAKYKLSILSSGINELSDIPVINGQLIFVKNRNIITLDMNSSRTFYRGINTIDSESELKSYERDSEFVFVKESHNLYVYLDNNWIQLVDRDNAKLIKGERPLIGDAKGLYVDSSSQNISVWDEAKQKYVIVGEVIHPISLNTIDALFK